MSDICEACAGLRDTGRLKHALKFLEGCKLKLNASSSALIKAFGASQQMQKAIDFWQSLKQAIASHSPHIYNYTYSLNGSYMPSY